LLIVVRLLADHDLAFFQDFVMRTNMLCDKVQRRLPIVGGPMIAVFGNGHDTAIGLPFDITRRGTSTQTRERSQGQE
jgi:hypothetical protein